MDRRLVIVDNDEAVLRLLELDLGLEGHEIVATALDGEKGLGAVAEHHPEVVVVDLRLGAGIDGLDVARQLKGNDIRVVLYTNYITPDVVTAAERVGATLIEKGNLSALRRAVAA
jgi:DNA-binding NtrC family response regulator